MNVSPGKSGSIRSIDRASVHKICSGQVVLTLATAVKELVENSIDAGATNIEVKLKEYGSELIEVSDNGSGVKSCDYESLTLKHHTSKLGDFSDLLSIGTFGFRGEALSSLCALSKITITTCHQDSVVGNRLEYDHDGKLIKTTPMAREVGTTVLVENLFSTLPVRHKEFQKNLRKEFGKMVQLLTAYCLISTGKRITCVNNTVKGKKSFVLSTNGEQTVRQNISCIFGPKQVGNLMEFNQKQPSAAVLEEFNIKSLLEEDIFRIEGYLSPSTHGEGRSASDRQFFFVNGRPCDLPKVAKIINDVYHTFNRHQYPFVCLNILLLKEFADVNVTPDKRQIFISHEKVLLAIIKTSVLAMYEHQPSTMKTFSFDLFKRNNDLVNGLPDCVDVANSENKAPLLSKLKRSCDTSSQEDFSPPVFKSPRIDDAFANNDSSDKQDPAEQVESMNVKNFLFDSQPKQPEISSSNPVKFAVTLPFKEDMGIKKKDAGFTSISSFINVNKFARESKQSYSCVNKTSRNISRSKPTGSHKSVKTKQCLLSTPNKLDIELIIQQHEFDLSNNLRKNSFNEDDDFRTDSVKLETFSSPTRRTTNIILEHSKSSEGEISKDQKESVSEDSPCPVLVDECQQKKRKYVPLNFLMEDLKQCFKSENSSSHDQLGEKYRKFRSKINSKDAEQELQKEISKDMFPKMDIIGQFNLGFIITKFEDDLFIIDQHATDEKYNFEILQRETILETQKLLNPQTLELTPDSESVLLDNLSVFERNGFKFNTFSDGKPGRHVQLVSVPVSQNWSFGKEDVDELIFMLSDNSGKMCRPSRVSQMFASRACRKSVMIGSSLSYQLMKKLVCHMGEIEQPWNCPHGRPTMRHLFSMNLLH